MSVMSVSAHSDSDDAQWGSAVAAAAAAHLCAGPPLRWHLLPVFSIRCAGIPPVVRGFVFFISESAYYKCAAYGKMRIVFTATT